LPEGLLAYWTPTGRRGVGNGPTEATDALIRNVKHVGHGLRNFDNYRIRPAARCRPGLASRALAGSACHPDEATFKTLGGLKPPSYGGTRAQVAHESREELWRDSSSRSRLQNPW
jgi:hypothetical protein